MEVRSSRGSSSGSRRAQPAPGKRAPERSSGGEACQPGAATAASAGVRPGPSPPRPAAPGTGLPERLPGSPGSESS
ncbi:unnamed protein product [Rangifer tarandus platyrhynchus]|uniref:Uncharacterized protein n=2 Tax=Rangifer tarandus platyrhynchus TaxID=3082113 RepID=A0ABN8YMM8_RANTA|nr:unnamed protein product [Rangifer tarandus platyrhynchus]CAI9701464.1 unnamed protein product [Rangifer tarandus platyrhynchus]